MPEEEEGQQQQAVNWDQMWSQFRRNVQPAKLDALVKAWGISHEATQWLGIGWNGAKMAWIFREFDDQGQITGLTCRAAHSDGTPKKAQYTIPGSTRGLIYAPDPGWGGIPTYIDHAIPIPEGASDVLASLSIGMYAIGRPSATGSADSNAWLAKAVKDRDIALCMEYDKGAGMVSVLDHAKRLYKHAKSIRFLEPPEGCKDIRQWIARDFAVEEIQVQLDRKPFEASTLKLIAGDVLTSQQPMDVAKTFILENFNQAGCTTIRRWNERWMHWDGHGYMPISEERVRGTAYRYLNEKLVLQAPKGDPTGEWREEPFSPNRHKVGNVVDAARAVDGVALDDDAAMPCWLGSESSLPKVQNLIVFKNGILDVREFARTGKPKWFPKTPQLFTQNYCPYNFSLEALPWAQPFIDWLYGVLGECPESVELYRRWLGYCMTNDNSQEKFMFMYGRPSAGKGTAMEVMEAVIGSRNVYSMQLESLGDGFSLYSALGYTNIFMPDTQAKNFERSSKALEVIKTITGRGPIDVAGKGIQASTYRLNNRFTIAANEIPNFHDSASALRRRLLVLPFPNSYEGRINPKLKEELTQEKIRMGVAAWAVGGYINLLNEGGFPVPAASLQISRDFEESNNPIAAFFNENCIIDEMARTPKKTIRESYEAWCKENGYRPWKPQRFKLAFAQHSTLIEVEKSTVGEFEMGKRIPIYTCVRLRGPFDA